MAKRHEGMKIEPPAKSCTAKQASLGDVGTMIQAVPRKKISSKSYNIVNRYNIVKESAIISPLKKLAIYSPRVQYAYMGARFSSRPNI